ncbi:DUF1737 domain-containing protein [Hymenobacter arizonensis]|uniref:DUF1737 domain-containing protein n=1 Tax=Hymenobacter arizonensis TaxID=1227077 RepID=UPI0015A5CDB8|nr:DUF1737 domain-containing protein [Hymenobacter arizonensis]
MHSPLPPPRALSKEQSYADYIVVRDNDCDDIGAKVRQKLAEGYRCRGKLIAVQGSPGVIQYIQNMVKL